MKGSIISVIEVMLTGIVLILAFYHFFPQYVIRSRWDRVLLSVKVMDTLNTIDGLKKTYLFATDSSEFNSFMERILKPEVHGAMVWWKETMDLSGYTEDMEVPYFTEAYKENIVDVYINRSEYSVDSYTVALWHFNENGGTTVYDETTNDNDGNFVGDTDWTTDCIFGSCLEFDGNGDYVRVPDPGVDSSLDIEDEITIEAWVKPRSLNNDYTGIVFKVLAYGLTITDEGNITGFIYHPGPTMEFCSGKTQVQLDEWVHIAMSFSSSTGDITLFYNGHIDTTCPLSSTNLNENNNELRIGTIGTRYFDGNMDEVRISNTTRTSFESFGQFDPYTFTIGLGYPY